MTKVKKMKNGKKKTIITTIILILLCVGIGFSFVPLFKNLKFGLDLQGGFEVLYKVESIDGSKMTNSKMTATYKTLSKRIDSLGVTEPEIILEGNDKIRIKLAGVTNQEEARSQLSTVATLSFRDSKDNLLMDSSVLNAGAAKVSQDSNGKPAVLLSVKNKDKFYDVTNKVKDYEDNVIVIWLDYEEGVSSYSSEKEMCGTSGSNCLSAATVSQGFASDVIIQGNFTEEEVNNLVDLINSGSLPSKLTEISSRTVGASFGDATLMKTLLAGIIGVSLIAIMLIGIYHFAGVISTVSVFLYSFLVFAVFWVVGGVLTLPGIAALVLGIGMAVDANVITFSRIKEELYKGKSLSYAFKEGSKSSLRAIVDSNITTLLVAIIMFCFGESSVKGFATMLIITIAVTMFTMVVLTRFLLGLFVKTGFFDDKTMAFIGVEKEDIPNVNKGEMVKKIPFEKVDFLHHAKKITIFSIVIIIAGIFMFAIQGFHLGIDYQAGSNITIETAQVLNKETLKKDLKELKLNSSDITITEQEASVQVSDVLSASKVQKVNNYFEEKYQAKVDIGVVSNVVKEELIKNAFLSILLSMFGIIIYISLRFRPSYGIGAVVALLHDIGIIFAMFAIFHLEISVMFIAAILAIIGYSINDTIVCFDRVRENLEKNKDKKLTESRLKDIINISICETFTRSLYTSITTILPVLALIFLGSSEILNFNLAMLIGLVSGTYSSIFIATVLFYLLERKNIEKRPKEKRHYRDEVQEKKIKGVNC